MLRILCRAAILRLSSFEDASKDVPLASKFLLAAFSDYDCKTPKEDVLLWHFR